MGRRIEQNATKALRAAIATLKQDNDLEEAQSVLRTLGVEDTDETPSFSELFSEEGEERIEGEELQRLLLERLETFTQESPEDELDEAFRIFDLDQDGKISAEQFQAVMREIGENISDEDVALFMRAADTDGDGLLSLEEFRSALNLL